MACQNNCGGTPQERPTCRNNNTNFLIIVVLYILLAIILGAWIIY
jgi:hypothetical protein